MAVKRIITHTTHTTHTHTLVLKYAHYQKKYVQPYADRDREQS